jgi:hypothetical protein
MEDKKDPLEKILQESERSLHLDIHNLSEEIARAPLEISRWLGYHASFILKMKELDNLISSKYLKLFEYYQGKTEATKTEKPFPKKVLKSDVDLYINSDHEYQVLLLKREKLSIMAKVCEQTIKTLNSRSFDIKNYIEYEKFKNGVN